MAEEKQTILAVDDVPENLDVLNGILEETYAVQVALSGRVALKIASGKKQPDLILLDVMMPEMDGFEVCRELKKSALTRNIPVIFVTARDDVADEAHGLSLGAVDYISKPVSPPIVLARIATHLALYDQNRVLTRKVAEATAELALAHDVAFCGMANLAEYRDSETGGHILRTRDYVGKLARKLMPNVGPKDFLDAASVDLLVKSVPMHDIGKVGIPDAILLKPGKLTFQEFETMKRHTIIGYNTIRRSESNLKVNTDNQNSFLRFAREVTRSHHEKWDGSGYPDGLAGRGIPVAGRLMALADVYDALISKRVYKPAFPHRKAVEIICKDRGTHFDPDIVDAFVEIEGAFKQTAIDFAESEEERTAL